MDFNKEKKCFNRFIELTSAKFDTKILINLDNVSTIMPNENRSMIEFNRSMNYIIGVKESYEEICNLIKEIC